MKLKFKRQRFQTDAAEAVCEAFEGQPFAEPFRYILDPGNNNDKGLDFTTNAFRNLPLTLLPEEILKNIRDGQYKRCLEQSEKLEGDGINLTVEMETGTGKTYVYIKTMFELNKRCGWSKFIVVVPSVAVREGVYKSFEATSDHFYQEYGKKIRFFIYDSKRLNEVEQFASDGNINVMIINSQAFNARGKDARRIFVNLDAFKGRRPMDVIAKTNPILIVDEPQSVEGAATKEALKKFNALFTLRYSATHRESYNLIYRLDAIDAYNKKLIKKIAVKGVSICDGRATSGYVYLSGLNLSVGKNPTATLEFDFKGKDKIRKITRVVAEGFDLYEKSGCLDEYKNGWTVSRIDGRTNSIEFANGLKLTVGEVLGDESEEQLRRIQIRETIKSHLERERELFYKGIKVLSLFFIDEVEKYRLSNDGNEANGVYAKMFEEEYENAVKEYQPKFGEEEYVKFLRSTKAEIAHKGYFSIDKKNGKFANSKVGRRETISDDADAYNLIMKNKERLLDKSEPTRFIFSHSALREGWDNPNVFQICALKKSSSDIRRRQEIGRGLRLCVNQNGERMDGDYLSEDAHNINVLTVIPDESYETFVKNLQRDIADDLAYRLGETLPTENARANNIELKLDEEKLKRKEFQKLWNKINGKSAYTVSFDADELIKNSAKALNDEDSFKISSIAMATITEGEMSEIKSKRTLEEGEAFKTTIKRSESISKQAVSSLKYDLIGKLVEATKLMRADVSKILRSLDKSVFKRFAYNPEEFILNAGKIINEQKAAVVVERIEYNKIDSAYRAEIFTEPNLRGRPENTCETKKNIYSHVIADSKVELKFAKDLEKHENVRAYAKLPRGFYISTPLGKYNPDWAIAFNESDDIKHIYFVAETKGNLSSLELRGIEKAKIECARKHFKAVSSNAVKYDVVDGYQTLLEKVMK